MNPLPRTGGCDREQREIVTAGVERERRVQRALSGASPFVVAFREVFLTRTHLCIAMEYVSGGEVFAKVATQGRLPEREARRLQLAVLPLSAVAGTGLLALKRALLARVESARAEVPAAGEAEAHP